MRFYNSPPFSHFESHYNRDAMKKNLPVLSHRKNYSGNIESKNSIHPLKLLELFVCHVYKTINFHHLVKHKTTYVKSI